MKTLRSVTLFLFSLLAFSNIHAQEQENLVIEFDNLSYEWDRIAELFDNYEGLGTFCSTDTIRTHVIEVLNGIHHYDSLIYDVLFEKSLVDGNHEIQKTIEQIQEFESEYSIKGFMEHLKVECHERSEVEHNRKNSVSDIGADSYDGQREIVETATFRYIKHVTKLVDHIRAHIHHLNLENSVTYK